MNIKIANTTLIGLVSLLLFLAILVLVKILFAGSKGFEFEWGNVSDWVSSLASVGALVVAYLAYKAAPGWFTQKQNEAGFNHIASIMANYDQQVLNIQKLHFDIITVRASEAKFDIIASQISKHIYETFELEHKLSSCARWNITYPQELKESFDRLSGYYNQSFGIIIFRTVVSDDRPETQISSLDEIREKIMLDSKSLRRNIEDIFTFPKQT